jgi:hypothetical protein
MPQSAVKPLPRWSVTLAATGSTAHCTRTVVVTREVEAKCRACAYACALASWLEDEALAHPIGEQHWVEPKVQAIVRLSCPCEPGRHLCGQGVTIGPNGEVRPITGG